MVLFHSALQFGRFLKAVSLIITKDQVHPITCHEITEWDRGIPLVFL